MTSEEKKKLFKILSAPFTDEAIERTNGRVTGKGYDTTGIKYIYIVARLNEVLGIGGYRTDQSVKVREGTTAKGRTVFDASCDLTLQLGEWMDGKFVAFAEAFATGGHQSVSEADARKGSYTNAFKKAAAMFGCGQQAYMGTLDDDNTPGFSDDDRANPPPPEHESHQSRPYLVRTEQAQRSGSDTNNQNGAQPQHVPNVPTSQASHTPNGNTGTNGTQGTNGSGGGGGSNGNRNRLSSKQLGAIWALSRKCGYEQGAFRQKVKARFNCQPEFLDKNAASTIIGELSARASNGAEHPAGEHAPQGATAGA
jgi:hypothetical protein